MLVFSASSRSVQRVLSDGGWHARSMILSLSLWPYFAGFPGRGRSFNPSIPHFANRFRQWDMATTDRPTFSAICLLFLPSDASRMALILCTNCIVLWV
jgi:hypothetical protein